jgi:hypothetical protein
LGTPFIFLHFRALISPVFESPPPTHLWLAREFLSIGQNDKQNTLLLYRSGTCPAPWVNVKYKGRPLVPHTLVPYIPSFPTGCRAQEARQGMLPVRGTIVMERKIFDLTANRRSFSKWIVSSTRHDKNILPCKLSILLLQTRYQFIRLRQSCLIMISLPAEHCLLATLHCVK